MSDTANIAGFPPVLAPVVQPYVDRQVLAGMVLLVADSNRVLDLETVGYADLAAGTPMGPDTLFWIASQTKPITATALMMLVDEGQVEIAAPAAEYLPELRDLWQMVEQDDEHQLLRRPARPVTVRDLLTHTSGMPFSSAVEQPTLDMPALNVRVLSYSATPLQFPPGSRYMYSNAGINAVGRIIEVVSGRPYETCMDERLFQPLGMTDTTFWPTEEQLSRLAKAYRSPESGAGLEEFPIQQLQYPLNDRRREPMPAGGLFSTAADCAVFCQMIANGGVLGGERYLSEAGVAQMTTRQTDPAWAEGYGLGWGTGDGWFGHGGALATNMEIEPGRGLITIRLLQGLAAGEAGAELFTAIKERLQTAFSG